MQAAQVERLTYVLAHSVKENLVARAEEHLFQGLFWSAVAGFAATDG